MARSAAQVSALGKRKRGSAIAKRRAKSRTYRSSSVRTSNPQSMVVHRGIGMPDKFRTKLVWCESIVLGNFNTTITQFKAWNMANPYDPDPAIGGGQPTYFDTFASVYNVFNVVGSKLTVTFTKTNNSGVTADGPYMVGTISNLSSSIASTDAPTLCTTPNCQWTILHENANKSLVATYSPKMITADGNNAGSTSSGGLINYYSTVWASPQGTAVTGTVNAIVSIEYIVDFYNLKQVVDL